MRYMAYLLALWPLCIPPLLMPVCICYAMSVATSVLSAQTHYHICPASTHNNICHMVW